MVAVYSLYTFCRAAQCIDEFDNSCDNNDRPIELNVPKPYSSSFEIMSFSQIRNGSVEEKVQEH